MTSNYQQNFENANPVRSQQENLVTSSYNISQHTTIAPTPGIHTQWNSSWPPPPSHCQFYQPLPMQSHWPVTPPINDGSSYEFHMGHHNTFQTSYYGGGESSFENKFDNRRSFDSGGWYQAGSSRPNFEDDQDEPEEKTEREKIKRF